MFRLIILSSCDISINLPWYICKQLDKLDSSFNCEYTFTVLLIYFLVPKNNSAEKSALLYLKFVIVKDILDVFAFEFSNDIDVLTDGLLVTTPW